MNQNVLDQNILIDCLKNPGAYPHHVQKISIIETHISWIILTGFYAYKIKKSLNLRFINTTELSKRYKYCKEEILQEKTSCEKNKSCNGLQYLIISSIVIMF